MIPLVGAAFAQVGVLDLGGGATLAPHGFVDVGWFDVGGDGTSYAYDRTEPQDGTWVYSGDPWAATINSQGDPGDLGNRFNNLQRHDRIASGGRPTFLVNTIEQSASVASPSPTSSSGSGWSPAAASSERPGTTCPSIAGGSGCTLATTSG